MMEQNSIIHKIRKTTLNITVWLFVSTLILLIIFTLIGFQNLTYLSEIASTLVVICFGMAISINNLYRMENKNVLARIVAIVGLVATICSVILFCLAIWNIFPIFERSYWLFSSTLTDMGRVTSATAYIALYALLGSNMLTIKEKSQNVTILKVVAFVCLCYVSLYAILIGHFNLTISENFTMLFSILNWAFFIATIAAWLISKMDKCCGKCCHQKIDCHHDHNQVHTIKEQPPQRPIAPHPIDTHKHISANEPIRPVELPPHEEARQAFHKKIEIIADVTPEKHPNPLQKENSEVTDEVDEIDEILSSVTQEDHSNQNADELFGSLDGDTFDD